MENDKPTSSTGSGTTTNDSSRSMAISFLLNAPESNTETAPAATQLLTDAQIAELESFRGRLRTSLSNSVNSIDVLIKLGTESLHRDPVLLQSHKERLQAAGKSFEEAQDALRNDPMYASRSIRSLVLSMKSRTYGASQQRSMTETEAQVWQLMGDTPNLIAQWRREMKRLRDDVSQRKEDSGWILLAGPPVENPFQGSSAAEIKALFSQLEMGIRREMGMVSEQEDHSG